MTIVMRVRNWDQNFETHESRKYKRLAWLAMPVKQDGDGYTDLVLSEDGPFGAHAGPLRLAAWVAMLQLAGRCSPRGTLWRSMGSGMVPHDAKSIARVTRLPEDIIADAIPKLIEIGWLEMSEIDGTDHVRDDLPECRENLPELRVITPATGQDRTEQDITGRDGTVPGPAAGLRPLGDRPPSKPNKRERLLDVLKRFGCSMTQGSENIFAEWCNVVADYSVEWIEHLMAIQKRRPHLPSGLRKLLKDTHPEWVAWKSNPEGAQ